MCEWETKAEPVEVKRVLLVLVDISGYTQFVQLHWISVLHAEQIVTELIEAVVDAAKFPLSVNKLEGDAAFLYAETHDQDMVAAQDVAQQIMTLLEGFKAKQQELVVRASGGCPCPACCNIGQLRLKAIAHAGEAAFKRIRQFEELAGQDVILIHRLLKNSIPAKEYIVMTQPFFELSGGVPGETAESRREHCEGIGEVPVLVFYPPSGRADIPVTRPMSRPGGLMEMERLSFTALWRRLRWPKRAKRVFANIPA